MAFSDIRLDVSDHVARLTLARPNSLNAITKPMRSELCAALDEIAEDRSTRCVVLSGEGRAFCAGQDLNERRPVLDGQSIDLGAELANGLNRVVQSIVELPVPVIGQINGDAVGAGASLALACDIMIMADTARLHFSFVRLGLVPDAGTSWLLTRKAGAARASSLLLTGGVLDAASAYEAGIAAQICKADLLAEQTSLWAQKLVGMPPEAVCATKALIGTSMHDGLAGQLEKEAAHQSKRGFSTAYKQALGAFFRRS